MSVEENVSGAAVSIGVTIGALTVDCSERYEPTPRAMRTIAPAKKTSNGLFIIEVLKVYHIGYTAAMRLTKTDFLLYLDSPLHWWAKANNRLPQVPPTAQEQYQRQQGYAVEALAKEFLRTKVEREYPVGSTIAFEVVLVDGNFESRIDALVHDVEHDTYDLYEIKSGTSIHSHHKSDITFQYLVGQATLAVHGAYIVHIDREYRHNANETPHLESFFHVHDMMPVIRQRQADVQMQREQAWQVLSHTEAPTQLRCTRPATCPCIDLCWPELPEYSIFELSRVSQLQLQTLLLQGITKITEIPEAFELTFKQRLQRESARTSQPVVIRESVQDELSRLQFPLYFLDYETYSPAVPLCDGYAPYQAMTFQFSLHIVSHAEATESEYAHHEFLATQPGDPSTAIATALTQAIGPTGSVIVWNKGFECGRNTELAKLCPQFAEQLLDINTRTYDLMDIFSLGWYVDARFHGSASIKKVLPVLVPELSYAGLSIGEGATAMIKWYESVYGTELASEQRQQIWDDLRTYCGLDTLAMVKIWQYLQSLA